MKYDLENLISGTFGNFVAAVIMRTMEYIFNKNKGAIKNFISPLWWKKNSGDNNNNGGMSVNHPNTPFTYNGKEFVAHS